MVHVQQKVKLYILKNNAHNNKAPQCEHRAVYIQHE